MPAQVTAMTMRQGMRPVLFGLVAGVAIWLFTGRVLSGELYEVQPNDPLALLAVFVALSLTAVAACWAPVRRATRVDPARALRFD